jgi:8-oxo-dGTP pyrophosphatase MutT (NUDIX family)
MWYPDVTVAAICEKDGQFLIVEERSKSTGEIVLNQPAGHVEDGEAIIEAAKREMLEETCCHFSPSALTGLYRLRTAQQKTYIRYTFCGHASDVDRTLILDSDIIDTHWLSLDELEAKKNLRSDLVLRSIYDFLAGNRYPLDILKELT